VGEHGSSLGHVLWMNPPCGIVEITHIKPDYHPMDTVCFRTLAHSMGCSYFRVPAQHPPPGTSTIKVSGQVIFVSPVVNETTVVEIVREYVDCFNSPGCLDGK